MHNSQIESSDSSSRRFSDPLKLRGLGFLIMIDFYNLYQNLTLVLLFEWIRDYLGRRNLTLILFYVPSTPKLPVSKDEEFTDRSVELDCTFLIVRIVFIPSLSRVFFILYDATCQT